jgi:hypothetical protein
MFEWHFLWVVICTKNVTVLKNNIISTLKHSEICLKYSANENRASTQRTCIYTDKILATGGIKFVETG